MTTETLSSTPVGEVVGGHARPVAKPRTGWKPVRFLEQLGRDVINDNITDVGAMMAYYAVLALFPMLVFTITVGMLVIDRSTIEAGIAMATRTMPASVATIIANQVRGFVDAADAGFAIGAAAFALFGASRGTAALGGALNAIHNKEETRGYFHRQAIAIAVTFGVATLVLIALGLLVIGPIVGHYVADRFGLGEAFEVAWGIGRWLGAGVLVMIVWAVIYKFLPDTDVPFRIFTPGALVGVLLWLGISYLFGLYLTHFNRYEATYGAFGGAIIFLTWLWLSNIALLFGAEVNDVLVDFRKDESAAAAQLADEREKTHAA